MMRAAATLGAVLALLSGCASMLDNTSDAYARLQRHVGASAEQFFGTYGLPAAAYPTSDGGTLYEWRSDVRRYTMPSTTNATSTRVGSTVYTYASTTPGTSTSTFCVITLSVRDGKVMEARIVKDTIGDWSLSRCSEVFQ